jgi:hypothetical protein
MVLSYSPAYRQLYNEIITPEWVEMISKYVPLGVPKARFHPKAGFSHISKSKNLSHLVSQTLLLLSESTFVCLKNNTTFTLATNSRPALLQQTVLALSSKRLSSRAKILKIFWKNPYVYFIITWIFRFPTLIIKQ